MNASGDLIVVSKEQRSQGQNRERAVARLNYLVGKSLKERKTRIETKPGKVAKESRLSEKKRTSEKKKLRGRVRDY